MPGAGAAPASPSFPLATTQRHLHKRERVNLGSYYTPEECVRIVRDTVSPYLDKDTALLDSACGYGSFLGNDMAAEVVGADIDGYAVATARRLHPGVTVLHRNALVGVSRESFGNRGSAGLRSSGTLHTTTGHPRFDGT